MKKLNGVILLLFLFVSNNFSLTGQTLTGKVIDTETQLGIEYASIGILNTSIGTITNMDGSYYLNTSNCNDSLAIRVSMIGYKPKKFSLKDFKTIEKIYLERDLIVLDEVIIKSSKTIKVGSVKFDRNQGWSGWGGLHVRKGYEIGFHTDLGELPCAIDKLHVRLHRQSFDTCYFRLHIREINDSIIGKELLTENIVLKASEESGWIDFDLTPYHIVLDGNIAVSLEWLKTEGVNEDREMKINKRLNKYYILFKNSKKSKGIYRWGTEAKWNVGDSKGPCMYLSVRI